MRYYCCGWILCSCSCSIFTYFINSASVCTVDSRRDSSPRNSRWICVMGYWTITVSGIHRSISLRPLVRRKPICCLAFYAAWACRISCWSWWSRNSGHEILPRSLTASWTKSGTDWVSFPRMIWAFVDWLSHLLPAWYSLRLSEIVLHLRMSVSRNRTSHRIELCEFCQLTSGWPCSLSEMVERERSSCRDPVIISTTVPLNRWWSCTVEVPLDSLWCSV